MPFTAADWTHQAKLNRLGPAVVPAGTTKTWVLPSLDLAEPGIKPPVIRIDRDLPVTVVQRNRLDFAKVATTDSIQLLLAHFLGTEHLAAPWVTTPTMSFGKVIPGPRATLTVVATTPGTSEVTVKTTVAMDAGRAAPLGPGKVATLLLEGPTVQELQAVTTPMGSSTPGGDPTGTGIASDKPVSVFAVVSCLWGKRAVALRRSGGDSVDEVELARILATNMVPGGEECDNRSSTTRLARCNCHWRSYAASTRGAPTAGVGGMGT